MAMAMSHLGPPGARLVQMEAVFAGLPEGLEVVVSVLLRIFGPLAERAADVQTLVQHSGAEMSEHIYFYHNYLKYISFSFDQLSGRYSSLQDGRYSGRAIVLMYAFLLKNIRG